MGETPFGLPRGERLSRGSAATFDEYAKAQGITSRSAAVHTAVRMLRSSKLGDSYAAAWQEWADPGEDEIWASTSRDGLS